jgi:hypothetical protein
MSRKFSRQIFEKYSSVKFHENPSNGSRFFHADRWETDTTKLIVAFRNFANAPINEQNDGIFINSHESHKNSLNLPQ